MLIDYWARFGETPIYSGISLAIGITFVFYSANVLIHSRAVTGTRRSYQSASIIKALIWPLFAGYVFCTVMNLFTQDWVAAVIDGWISIVLLRDWERYKDTDDWWKGRGTKLKKKLKSLFTASSPAMAGAGA